jgi:thiamine biosynthesis lipoprotein
MGPRPGSVACYRTRGIGTVAEVVVADPSRLAEAAQLLEAELALVDRLASRFRDDSEVRMVCQARGEPVRVSPELFELLQVTLAMAEATDGALDPTVGGAVCRLGYDRDFASVSAHVPDTLPDGHPVPGWRTVRLDPERRTVRVDPGVHVDLGTTGKAWAADRTAQLAADRLGCSVLVSLGGDVAVRCRRQDEGFAVAIEERCDRAPSARAEVIQLASGGLATSGTTARHWRVAGQPVHHIVDPRTGRPTSGPWRTVSVVASSCVGANAAATASFVKGWAAPGWLHSLGLAARLVDERGTVLYTAGWPAPTEEAGR